MQLDLSTLSGPDLRQMLDATRGRGQAAQSYEILQEMARRREAGERRRRAPRRPGEPHIIDVDFGDPLDRDDEFEDLPSETPAEPPLILASSKPPPPPTRSPKPPRRITWLAVGLVVGVVAGTAAGLQLGPQAFGLVAPAPEATNDAELAATVAAAQPPPAPVDAAVPEAHPAPPPAELALEVAPEPAPPPIAEPPPLAVAQVAEAPKDIVTAETHTEEAPACEAAATPADRTICADPDLRGLQRKLQKAYAEAMAAHADRGLLRERQLTWRDERNNVSDPDRLAELYKARIRKLEAATSDARRQQAG
jgi:hypothetical protein